MKRSNIEKCRILRKNQTDAENKLWYKLRNRQLDGVKFRRQFSVGKYIIDFYSAQHKLGIEIDGGQHYDDKGIKKDAQRTNELAKVDIKIIRFNNLEVLNNIEGVCETILNAITPHLNPLPRRGEEIILTSQIRRASYLFSSSVFSLSSLTRLQLST